MLLMKDPNAAVSWTLHLLTNQQCFAVHTLEQARLMLACLERSRPTLVMENWTPPAMSGDAAVSFVLGSFRQSRNFNIVFSSE